MLYVEHKPRWPLSEFIHALWYCEGYNPPHRKERVLPNGTTQIVFSLKHDTIPEYGPDHTETGRVAPVLIAGVHSEYQIIGTESLESMAGVSFWPGGARPFLRVPLDELANTHVTLESIWGPGSRSLRERLQEAPAPADKFAILEQALLEAASSRLEPQPLVKFALQQFSSVPHIQTVAEVTSQVGLSPKRFIQIFREQVGLSPKLFCRIRRFQQALHLAASGGRISWADVAASCGYFDQAHFVHDFRAFSGLNPTSYSSVRSDWVNHVPLPD